MLTIENIKIRVRQILDDDTGERFSDALLTNAIRQALAHLDEKLPLVRNTDFQITTTGREQTLIGMVNPLYLIKVSVVSNSMDDRVRDLKTGYSYSLQGETSKLHFNGSYIPDVGETLRVTYAAQNMLAGLDNAEETTLSNSMSTALETCSASFACLLRAASLTEAYGARPGESARLAEQSKLWKEVSEESLNKLKTSQEFEFPAGFELDHWDR